MKRGLRYLSATEGTNFAGGDRKLTAACEVETRNGNETPALVEASPQGINPKILILDVTVATSGEGIAVMGWKAATPYVKPIAPHQYSHVTFRSEDNSETIEVTELIS